MWGSETGDLLTVARGDDVAARSAALALLVRAARARAGTLFESTALGALEPRARHGDPSSAEIRDESGVASAVARGAVAVPLTIAGARFALVLLEADGFEALDGGALEPVVAVVERLLGARHLEARHALLERDHRALMDESSDGIFVTDAALRILTVNARAARMLGCEPGSLVGRRIADLLLPEDVATAPLRQDDLAAGVATRTERRFVHADGSTRVFDVSAYRTSDGRFIGLARDMTDRRLAEERIVRSEASFRALIEGSPDGVAVHAGGRFLYVNPARSRLLGYAHDELVGRPVTTIIDPADQAVALARMRRLMDGAPAVPFVEERFVRKDGSVVAAEVGAMQVVFQGTPAIVAIGRDVSERRRLLAELAQRDRLVTAGTLAAGVAHEINNPLTYVLIHLDLLARSLERAVAEGGLGATTSVERLAEVAREAHVGARRVASIVHDLLAYARTSPRSST